MRLSGDKNVSQWIFKNNVTPETYAELVGMAEPLTLSRGSVLIAEGDQSRPLFLLQSGSLSVSQRTDNGEKSLGTIEPGDVVGEIAFVDKRPRSATVTVDEDAVLLKLDHAKVGSLNRCFFWSGVSFRFLGGHSLISVQVFSPILPSLE